MIVYPAIDLIDGKCVRLFQGDFSAKKIYDRAPQDVVNGYKKAGAKWVHIVDLDGAKNPQNRQTGLIAELAASQGVKIQSGGGVRSLDDVENLLKAGISRVVIGSVAVRTPEIVKAALDKFGSESVCIAVDVMPDPDKADLYKVALSGWQETSDLALEEFLGTLTGFGLRHALCTDISRDGTLAGSNISLYRSIVKSFRSLEMQASGGVGGLDDVIALKDCGVSGVIVGKALYEGKMELKDILEVAKC